MTIRGYSEAPVFGTTVDGAYTGETIAANSNRTAGEGWGSYNQLIARVVVAGATGTTPTLNLKLQTLVGSEWIDVAGGAFTAVTAATSESKVVVRTGAVWWADKIRVVSTVGGTTPSFTGVTLTLIGARQ